MKTTVRGRHVGWRQGGPRSGGQKTADWRAALLALKRTVRGLPVGLGQEQAKAQVGRAKNRRVDSPNQGIKNEIMKEVTENMKICKKFKTCHDMC